MIRDAATLYANALGVMVGDGVTVLDHPPDAVAGPAIWLELDSVLLTEGSWIVRLRAVIVAPGGYEAVSMTDTLDELTDRAIAAGARAGLAGEVTAGELERQIGPVMMPARFVTAAFAYSSCDLPAPAPARTLTSSST